MPELPEVETVRQQITTYLPAKIISSIESSFSSSIIKTREFSLDKGQEIISTFRHGKVLVFKLSKQHFIVSGFGMSGGWRVSEKTIGEKHTHIQLKIRQNEKIFYLGYVDPRRFGKMHLLNGQKNLDNFLARLGPDLLSEQFNENYLIHLFKKFPMKIIKPFLLDQKFFAGCGNYIACEVLAHAGIHPNRLVNKISLIEIRKLIYAFNRVLTGNIDQKGLTFSGGYVDAFGEKGDGLNHLVVFHQKKCGLCGKQTILKAVMAGRGTYWCKSCQK